MHSNRMNTEWSSVSRATKFLKIYNLFQIITVFFKFPIKLSISDFKDEAVVFNVEFRFGFSNKPADLWIMTRKVFGKTL